MNRVRLALAAGACVLLVLAGLLASGPRDDGEDPARAAVTPPRVDFQPVRVTRAVRARRARAARRLGRGARLETDRHTGGVRFAGRLDGFLTGPREGDAADIALGYVRNRRRVFGLDRADLAQLELADRERSHGITLLRWTQAVDGVPLLEGSLRAAVADDGRIVNITGGAHPDLPRPGTPRLDEAAAIAAAAAATGGRAGDDAKATLVMTAATGEVRLAWRVLRPQGAAYYDQLVDAATGAEISRGDRVDHAVPGLVYDSYPGAPVGGTAREVDLQPHLHAGANELTGPRARVFADFNANDAADVGEPIFKDAQGTFKYTRNPYRHDPACPAAGCAWSQIHAGSWQTNAKQAGVQLFALLGQFSDHLATAPIGFDDFRQEPGGVDSDPMLGNVMDGANGPNGMPKHLNNAGMMVPPDGQSPTLQAYLYYALDVHPALNSADDASIVYHEYSHGLIGRTVVDALGWGALNRRQSAALNEGLADFFSLDYLVSRGLIADSAAPGEVRVGAHLAKLGSVRMQATDCPVGVNHPNCIVHQTPGGLTYADYGDVGDQQSEHYDGEILAQTMWQLRDELLAAHGPVEGENRIRSLAYVALQLSPPEPSYIDYRNALLQADRVLRQGADAERIWRAFGERGMGWYASTSDADDADPVASDEPGPGGITGQGTISGIVTDRDSGAPLAGATVQIGGHGRPHGSFETDTDGDGRFRFTGVPAGTYPHLFTRRAGYATQVDRDVEVQGETRFDVRIRRNWADTYAGAVIAGTTAPRFNGCRARRLADGSRSTSWGSKLADGLDSYSVDIQLPAPVRATSFAVDPTPHPHAETEMDPRDRCELGAGARPTRVRIEVASEAGGPWKPAVNQPLDDTHAYRMTELRPAAPLDDVRYVRVHMAHPVDGAARTLAFSEVQVYAAARRPPRAVFEYGPKPLDVGQTASFDAADSAPGDSPIQRYEWDLDGDGTFETDTGNSPITGKAYGETGRYRVGLRVTDADGEQDEFRALVLVARDYEIFDLGTLAPDDSGAAHAVQISPRGDAAIMTGHSGQTDQLPARYRGGAARPLDLLPNHVMGTVWEVNDDGQAVGSSYPARQFLKVDGVLWNGSTPTPVGTLGGSSSTAVGLNAFGWVVGWAYDSGERPRGYLKRPGNPMVDVQEEAGVPAAQRKTMKLVKINDAGVAVGCSGYTRSGEGCDHAVRYDGVTRTLTTLSDFGFGAGATDISADGRTVTGVIYDSGQVGRAAIWRDGEPRLVGLLGGHSMAMSVNAQGTLVGHLGQLHGFGAWIKREGEGTTMLDSLVPDSGWRLQEASGINDRDEIVGEGVIDGRTRGYQLNLGPCRVCVTDVQMQHRGQDIGADGTVEGNLVEVRVQVANHDDQPHVFQVEARESRKEQIDDAPTVSLDPGEDEWVELEWDTDGLAWKDGAPDADHVLRVRAVLGHTIYGGRSAVLKVRPRPVVLIPGALADASAWHAYPELLHRANPDWEAYAVAGLDTGRWSDLAHAPDTLDRHSEVLESFVGHVRAEEDAEQVDLVAHGLGGVIARQWIQDAMDEGVARRLIQLGTPNEGTPCAEITGAEAFYDLRRDVMGAFNARVTDRRGVEFSAFAGDVEPYTCVRGSEAGDGAVPVSSARWAIEDVDTGRIEHAAMPSSGALFTEFVKPRLDGTKGADAGLRAAVAEAPEGSARSHQLLAQRIETVPPGAGIDVPLDVEAGSQLDVTLLAPPQVEAELLNPDGVAVDTADSGTTRALTAGDPAPGRWHVRLRSGGNVPLQAAVSAAVRDDAWSLDLRRGRPDAEGRLPLIASITRFDRLVPDAAVTVEVQRRGAAPESVTLLDDGAHNDGLPGDGCYGADPAVAPGEALLRLRVRRGTAERLRTTWANVPAAGDGRRPRCPDARGRSGEIAFGNYAGGMTTWGIVDPLGATGSLPLPSNRVEELRWSPDGERLAFGDRGDVYVAKADGTEPVRVTTPDEFHREQPEWSADGTRLAYTFGCRGAYAEGCRVAVLDLETGQEAVAGEGAAPDWSPDGERLVVVRRNGETWDLDTDLWTIRLEDGHAERVTQLAGGVDHPVWSPTDDRIAFSRWDYYNRETEFGMDGEIYVVDADGGAVRNLTNDDEECDPICRGDMRDEAPSWSPDGRRIAFVSTRGEMPDPEHAPTTSQVWEMRPDGTGLRKRTNTPTWKIATAWRAVAWLDTVTAPRCFDFDVAVRNDATTRIPLDCTDDNGDHLTLRILEPPAHGTLTPIGENGAVRYTPEAGYTGADRFTYAASDEHDSSGPATVTITVSAPPPPPPPPSPTPPWSGGGISMGGGSGSGGGGGGRHDDDDEPRGPRPQIPSDCVVMPGTSWCYAPVGCQPGGDISGCTGRFSEAPRARRGSVAIAAGARARKLLKTVKLRIPAGETRQVRLRLTAAGQAQLRRKGKVAVTVLGEVRAGGRVLHSVRKTVVFRKRR